MRIVHGRGTGQWRHLVSPATRQKENPGKEITIDRPWNIEPDKDSWVSISDFQGRTLYVGNKFTNHPLLQVYFGTHDIIFAENRIGVPGKRVNVPLWVGDRRGGIATGWHYQVLDNMICHLGARFMTTVKEDGIPSGYSGALTGMHVYRGNTIENQSAEFYIRFPTKTEGLLIEANRGISRFDAREVKDTTGVVRGNLGPNGSRTTPTAPCPGVLVVK